MPGMAVNVRFTSSSVNTTIFIPQNAFRSASDLRRGAASTLFVVDGDRCVARSVWVNAVSDGQVEILSGLSAGDRVVLNPSSELKAGDLVTVKN
jgi:multidrug efflux pump subunit AcrA (membrane-fusion protein)